MPAVSTFHTPPECQGQMIELCYATTDDGQVIEHVYDPTDRSSTYRIARRLVRDDTKQIGYWNQRPQNKRWRPMTTAELRRYGLMAP